jgi:hypothetical protein
METRFRHRFSLRPESVAACLATAVVAGLIISQAIAVYQVHQSNQALYRRVRTALEAGYTPVPCGKAAESLAGFGAAFFGGLFFTFTLGVFLAVLSAIAAWIWHRFLAREKRYLILFALLPLWALFQVNRAGGVPIVSLYFLLIPAAVFVAAAALLMPEPAPFRFPRRRILITAAAAAVFAASVYPNLEFMFYLRVRDRLLLSAPGRALICFYYTYTLYPAEVFKSFRQKQLKTCAVEGDKADRRTRTATGRLLASGWFVLPKEKEAEIRTVINKTDIVFFRNGRKVLRSPVKEFNKTPQQVLRKLSRKTDRFAPFRRYVFLALLTVSGLIFFSVIHLFIHSLIDVVRAPGKKWGKNAVILAAAISFGVWIAPAVFRELPKYHNRDQLARDFSSQHIEDRIRAMHFMYLRGIDITAYSSKARARIIKSRHTADRFWYAKALQYADRDKTWHEVVRLINDPFLTVSYTAVSIIDRWHNRPVRELLVTVLRTSKKWYVQWYAYKVLRKIGWRQRPSISIY